MFQEQQRYSKLCKSTVTNIVRMI